MSAITLQTGSVPGGKNTSQETIQETKDSKELFSVELSLHAPVAALQTERFTLIKLPEQEIDPFIEFIGRAKQSIILTAYKLQQKRLTNPRILQALEAAVRRTVKVDLLMEDRLTSMEMAIKPTGLVDALQALKDRGIEVHTGSKDKPYNQIHTKFAIIDYETNKPEALLGTTNFDKDPEDDKRAPARDFSLLFSNREIIDELHQSFWSDIKGTTFDARNPYLFWGPNEQRQKLLSLIGRAENSIRIYQQDITDSGIVSALLLSLRNGVEVLLIMSPHPFGADKPDNNVNNQQELVKMGAKVYLVDRVSIHAKVMIIDDKTIYLGSTNFYQPAIDKTRNVGLLLQDSNLIEQMKACMQRDRDMGRLMVSSSL